MHSCIYILCFFWNGHCGTFCVGDSNRKHCWLWQEILDHTRSIPPSQHLPTFSSQDTPLQMDLLLNQEKSTQQKWCIRGNRSWIIQTSMTFLGSSHVILLVGVFSSEMGVCFLILRSWLIQDGCILGGKCWEGGMDRVFPAKVSSEKGYWENKRIASIQVRSPALSDP